jgi:RND family efflux transporter MFP subunit
MSQITPSCPGSTRPSKPVTAPINDRRSIQRRLRLVPILATLAVAATGTAAVALLWQTYMGRPWTRDGTVRAYVETLAPEVSGQVTELTVRDNQFVRKGDLLMKIDPRDYQVAVDFSKAAIDQAQADYDNKKAEAARRLKLSDLEATPEEQQTYVTSANIALATIEQKRTNLRQAKINLERTEIRSPVNGWVTNLLLHQGDYTTTGQTAMSLVDSDSFWIDGYFEETALGLIREGQSARIWLLGYREVLQGHVDSVARGIVVPNASPGSGGLASVNPIFTWVRLAQRIPVRVHIDRVPPDVRLVVGMTATVEVESVGVQPPSKTEAAAPARQ